MEEPKQRNITNDAIALTLIGVLASYFLGWPVLFIFLLFIVAEVVYQKRKN